MSKRLTLIPLAAFIAALAPGAAHAATSCQYHAFDHSVEITMAADGDAGTVKRAGDVITVNGAGCGGATVYNTNTIAWSDQSFGGTEAALDLSGGALGPGFSPNPGDTSPTIAMTVNGGGGYDRFTLDGTPQDDTFRIGSASQSKGYVNLDVAADGYFPNADVTLNGVEWADISAREGNNVVDAGAHDETGAGPFLGDLDASGGYGNDVLIGGSGNSLLAGGWGGDDSLHAGPGDTILFPGPGDDVAAGNGHSRLMYSDAPAGVHVDLSRTDRQATGGSGNDQVSGINYLVGSNFDDVLAGSESSETFEGRAGNDTLMGRGGDDLLYGGSNTGIKNGLDVASYAEPSAGVQAGVSVSLAKQAQAQDTGSEGSDRLEGISGVTGSPFADTLTGDATANRIDGGGGADTVNAGDGPDTVLLRDGVADHADCGGASDTVESDVAGLDVLTGCEQVAFAPFTPPAGQPGGDQPAGGTTGAGGGTVADTTLTFRFTASRHQRLGKRGVIRSSLLCPAEACSGDVSAKLAIGHPARRSVYRTVAIAAGQTKVVKLRLGARNVRRARAALHAGRKVTVLVTAVARDAAGNRRTVTRKVVLRG